MFMERIKNYLKEVTGVKWMKQTEFSCYERKQLKFTLKYLTVHGHYGILSMLIIIL
jgi:hypothetical protein